MIIVLFKYLLIMFILNILSATFVYQVLSFLSFVNRSFSNIFLSFFFIFLFFFCRILIVMEFSMERYPLRIVQNVHVGGFITGVIIAIHVGVAVRHFPSTTHT